MSRREPAGSRLLIPLAPSLVREQALEAMRSRQVVAVEIGGRPALRQDVLESDELARRVLETLGVCGL